VKEGAPTAIIADDERLLADQLAEQLRELWPELGIRALAGDGIEAMRCIDTLAPDVVFLDIEMPGARGIEIARHASGRCHVVFVTAFDQYAVEAFEQGAVDYVRKPVSAARLFATVKRLKDRIAQPPADLAPLLSRLGGDESARQPLRWISASRGEEICVIPIEDVVYFRAEDKYTVVYTASMQALIRRPIKALLEDLDPATFWQIHRATVVNANAIAGVRRSFRGNLEVRLKTRSEVLPVSDPYKGIFKQM
jgi:DNA-binding LytR/AlgR family response regulator